MDMPVNAAINQPVVGFSSRSHVYLRYPPLRCSIPDSRGVFYDDGNKFLLSTTVDQVFAWKASYQLNQSPSCDSINEGPISCIRYSLDGKLMAIQRSDHEVVFRNRGSGDVSSIKRNVGSEIILGLFWTDCPNCDIVLVKTSGLELFSYNIELRSPQLIETKRLNISWYTYTHESRLVLLASGMQCKTFSGFQFASGGIVRLPKFEMTMAKAEANDKPVLCADDVHIITVYGRIYCLQVDRVGMMAHLYRFYRDAVVQQGSLPIYSTHIAASVVDNVLLIHQIDAKVVILYDIFLGLQVPLSAPLPLVLSTGCGLEAASLQMMDIKTAELSDHGCSIYEEGWIFLVPDLIYDVVNGVLWKIQLDLEAIATSVSDVPFILEFLQRRRQELSKVKELSLKIIRNAILDRIPIGVISKAIDVLVVSYSQLAKAGRSVGQMSICSETYNRPPSDSNCNMEGCATSVHHECPIRRESVLQDSYGSHSDSVGDVKMNLHNENDNSSLGNDRQGNSHNNPGAFDDGIIETNPSPPRTIISSGSSLSVAQGSHAVHVAISPEEMYKFVFATVEDDMAKDSVYLVAVIVEYMRSCAVEKLKLHPSLHVMIVQLLSRSGRYSELGFFITNKILEPSKEVVLQLLESGRQVTQVRRLALDLLRQLGLHDDYVLALVQDGYHLEGLRYALKNKIQTLRPSLFLEAAASSGNLQHLAAVLRSLSDIFPGFKVSNEFAIYRRMLSQIQ